MADALLDPALNRAGGPQPDDRADSGYAVSPDPADPDDRPRVPGPGRPGSVMTEAPAQQRDRPGPASAEPPARPHGRRHGPASTGPAGHSEPGLLEIPDPSRGQWDRVRWLFAAIWLVYLAQPVSKLWSDANLAHRYLGLADLIAFSAVFIADVRRRPLPAEPAEPAAVAASSAWRRWRPRPSSCSSRYITLGPSASSLFIYVGVMAVFLLPTARGLGRRGRLYRDVAGRSRQVHGWTVDGDAWPSRSSCPRVAAWGVVQLIQRNAQLVAARNEITRLALADERNRFARDLHDILGHSLTVVAVKAELAGRLASLDPQRAETEIADVERIARQALADVRAAAAGYREITLAGELASARTALAAAGIEADLPDQDMGQMPAAPAGAVRLGGARGRDQRGAAQRRDPLPYPGQPQRGRDQRRRLRAARPAGVSLDGAATRDGQPGARPLPAAAGSRTTCSAWAAGAVPPAGTACPGCASGPPTRGRR